MRKKIHATSHRRDLCIYGGSRGQKETFVLGTGFLAISGILFLALDLSFGAAIVISLTGVGFPFLITFKVDLGHGVVC